METFTSALKYNQKVTDETDQFRDGRVLTFSWTISVTNPSRGK